MNETTSAESGTHPVAPPQAARPRIAGYRILDTIATGGMGVVYKAVQESLGRVVALKMISAGGLANENAGRRFHAEAEVVARLRHPSIVPIHEIGVADGHPFFTMDLIEGRSLSALVAEGPLAPRRAAGILVAVARAVAYAHGQGVVHRDLKPANILLDAQDAPWVTDFGLAKCVDRDQDLTTQGAVLGTPSYMAPEQATGEGLAITFRTDVYSLGAVLYATLTGRPPHVGGSSMATLKQVVEREPVPPRILNPAVDRDLETICLAAMRKAPERRYATADAFADDLERWLGARPIAARRPGTAERAALWVRRRPAVAALAAGVITVAALGLGGIVWQWREAVAANHDARIARERQHATQIEALRVADPAAVNYLIDEIVNGDVDLTPPLRAILAAGGASSRERLRVALALLAVEPATLEIVEAHAATATPDELMMIRSEVSRRRHLLPEGAWPAFVDRWWARANDSGDRQGSLRAAALLAGWAPADARWEGLRDSVTLRLVAEPAILISTWIDLFRPTADAVIPGLLAILGDRGAPEGHRAQAEDFLVELAAGKPDVLARCLLKARGKSFRRFLDAAAAASPLLVEHLRKVLEEPPPDPWEDPPLPDKGADLPPELRERVASAHGMLAERWAFVADADAGRFDDLDRDLGHRGFRLERLRPFEAADGLRIVAQWKRDGLPAEFRLGLTREEFAAEDARRRESGFLPEDLAGCFTGSPPDLRLSAVWIRPGTPEERRVLLGLPHAEHTEALSGLSSNGFHPWTLTVADSAEGVRAVSSVWRHRPTEPDFNTDLDYPAKDLDDGPHPARVLADLTISAPQAPAVVAGLWVIDPVYEDRILPPGPLLDHAARAESLVSLGFRPKAVACASGSGSRWAASVWIRPAVTPAAAESLARRRARASVGLMILGDSGALPRVLGYGFGTSVQIHACRLLAESPVPTGELGAALDRADTPALRIGILLALGSEAGNPAGEPIHPDDGGRIVAVYRKDPHAGVHAAAEWALRRLGLTVPDVDVPAREPETEPGPTWSRDSEGHTLVHIRGPVEFLMGTRGSEEGRRFGEERHRRRIPRSFAVASKEVTVAQFRRFLADRPEFAPDYPAEVLGGPEDPVCAVTWFHATQYCRWLSEREGIPHRQHCYPRSASVAPEFRLPAAVFERSGYRLPTEAEWEYLARAGTSTSRWCGDDPSLLDAVAWWRRNAEAGPRPTGSAMPNGFGLFDVLGNVVEWCHGRMVDYPEVVRTVWAEDGNDAEPFVAGDRRVLRGGSFDDLPAILRSGARRRVDGAGRSHTVGFRVARTVP